MERETFFDKINNSIKGQSSEFCSRATKVILVGQRQLIPLSLVVNYIDCDGIQRSVNYFRDVLSNNNYIPDCVQGGCPISITDGGGIIGFPEQPIPEQTNYKFFVEYGTTNCDVPPPIMNVTLIACGGGEYIVPSGYPFVIGGVYSITLSGLGIEQCYTVGGSTSLLPNDTIASVNGEVGDCNQCRRSQPI